MGFKCIHIKKYIQHILVLIDNFLYHFYSVALPEEQP